MREIVLSNGGTTLVDDMDIREKIARIIMDRFRQTEWILEHACSVAAEILSLPIEGCNCTLGELPEHVRKMRETLVKLGEFLIMIDGAPLSVPQELLHIINDVLKGD
jgi:hypothetical protein